ncbi:MAG: TldD/PmbA family protein [Acidimicrobiales bacterium]|nr:TldD/PmbA family protein [Acidimicrobiales bacterium]
MSTVETTDQEFLLGLGEQVLALVRPGEQMEVAVSSGHSTSVKVYGGEVESYTSADSSGAGIRIIADGREGFASAGTLDLDILSALVEDARQNAAFAEHDEHAGIAEPDGWEVVELDTWRSEVLAITAEERIARAIDLESRVLGGHPAISGVRTASYSDSAGASALVSTAGIRAANRSTGVSAMVQALAVDGDRSQTGFGWHGGRAPADVDMDHIVERAVSRATELIGAVKPDSATVELVLDPHLSATILGLTAGTLGGDRIVKKRSPFVGRDGQTIASPLLNMVDDPTDPLSLAAESTDGEGLATRPVPLVTNGVLDGFVWDSYNARKAGVASTGSAQRGTRGLPTPGVHALSVAGGDGGSLEDLIASVDLGIFVFSLAGLHSGVNAISGDFSVGVEGRMIRSGALAEPISECTLGSTLQRLLLDITSVGSDRTHLASGVATPSMIISGVRLSGS